MSGLAESSLKFLSIDGSGAEHDLREDVGDRLGSQGSPRPSVGAL